MEVVELQQGEDPLAHISATEEMPTQLTAASDVEPPGTVHKVGIYKAVEVCWIFDEEQVSVWTEVAGYRAGPSYTLTFKNPSYHFEQGYILVKYGLDVSGVWKEINGRHKPVGIKVSGHVCGRFTPASHWSCSSVSV